MQVGLVGRYGYYAEKHLVQSDDGYQLQIHRIPGSPGQPKRPGKKVIFLQHGMFASSATFVYGGPDRNFAYMLVDAGYDVWFGNARGNTYGRSHIELSPDNDEKFWDFSFHEIAVFDVAAEVDYVLNSTKKSSLIYIGHSMGTAISLILLSVKPDYNSKIHLVINLAPVGNWKNFGSPMAFIRSSGIFLKALLWRYGIKELFPRSQATADFLNRTCRRSQRLREMCLYTLGFDQNISDIDPVMESFYHFPAGTSSRTFYHFHQNMLAGKLQMYDYGTIGNLAHYGRLSPPVYNLQNIETPIVMIYSKGDKIAAPEDSTDLVGVLKNARAECVTDDNFGHFDFIMTKNMRSTLYDRIIEIIEEFSD
ncbi:hypothetical protein QAD02_008856 [Eretmocerus hayati]|uniref:Uncharacterized protein n=1 Tax=Eretmocerus hayati TaxID=131215 RepID=A0ACC2N7K6_9HYME|nr:hypothetical protein QAD02_008856 [Eretmocerus hayati]